MVFWRFGGKGWIRDWISHSMDDKGVCRTAPATPDLVTTGARHLCPSLVYRLFHQISAIFKNFHKQPLIFKVQEFGTDWSCRRFWPVWRRPVPWRRPGSPERPLCSPARISRKEMSSNLSNVSSISSWQIYQETFSIPPALADRGFILEIAIVCRRPELTR